jgi:hypothetical protein
MRKDRSKEVIINSLLARMRAIIIAVTILEYFYFY